MPPRLDLTRCAGNKQSMTASSSRTNAQRTASPSERKETRGSVARFVLVVAAFAWAFRTFVGAPFNIPSGSMLPTLYIGDYLAVAKWPYGYSRFDFPFSFPPFHGRLLARLPHRGDVVVFRHPREDSDLVKRVIGLPGDTVAVQDGRVILNGRLLPHQPEPAATIAVSANSPCQVVPPAAPFIVKVRDQPYCLYKAYLETLPGGPSYTVLDQIDHGPADDFPEARVPAGHVFLMGDNRDDSLDSRFPAVEGGIGMVPAEDLIGRAEFTFWSTDGSASWWQPWTWFEAMRLDRIGSRYGRPTR